MAGSKWVSEWVSEKFISVDVCLRCVCDMHCKSQHWLYTWSTDWAALDFHWNKADAVCLPAKWDFSGRCLLRPFFFFSLSTFLEYFIFLAVGKCSMTKKVVSGSFLPCLYFLNVYTFFLSSNCLTSPDYYLLSIAANHHQPSPPPILYQFVLVRRRDKFSENLFCARRIIHHATHLLLLLMLRNAINSL